ncbi:MAG: general secretion pathway protein D [Nitrospinales bacterium]|jgi:general secretion pathway protein D
MKKNIFVTIIISLSLLLPGCSFNKKSTMDRLKNKSDSVESMKLPDKDSSSRSQNNVELIDNKKLKRIKPQQEAKKIRVTGTKVSLRRGPGPKYLKIGNAVKGDEFELVRVERGFDNGRTWYLVRDSLGNKFFIAKNLTSIVKKTPATIRAEAPMFPKGDTNKVEKVELQKKQDASLDQIQTLVDVEPKLPEELREAKHITLNFEGTELYDVITTFCELLKIDYVIEGSVEGKVTLQTFNKIPVEDLYSVLEQILALNNVAVVRSGNFYRFLQAPDAAKKPLSIHYGNDPNIPDKERMIIQIVPLRYISVESMKKIISPLLTTNASFIEIPETNNLMMIEMAYNVKRIIKVIQALDIDKLASSDIQLYKLRNADSETLVKELEEIFTSMGYKEALGDSLSFLSLTRLNSVLVVNAFDKILPTIEFWVNRLDQPVSEGEVSTFVYYVQNGDASALSGLLNGIFTGEGTTDTGNSSSTTETNTAEANISGATTPASTSATRPNLELTGGINDDIEGEITIIPDPDTNSLIIRTSPRNYPAILSLINKLDLFPQQVLIEVLIVDLSVDETTKIGLDWAAKGTAGSTTVQGSVNQATTGATLGDSIGAVTASFLQGGSFIIGDPEKVIARLQVFASDSKANILANPILVTTDNKAANIAITDEIPIVQEASTPSGGGAVVTSSVEYRSVGIKLEITPKINSDNYVNLKILQEISSRGADVGTQPSFNTRQVNTEVVLKDNQVLIMGGLMRTDSTDTVSGVPFLKDLPFVGKLFGTESTTLKKTELMIFITPHVISNNEDSQFVTRQFKNRLRGLKKNSRS